MAPAELTADRVFVLLGSFLAQALYCGLPLSNGVFYAELATVYDDLPRSNLLWIVSIYTGFTLLGCPLASQICERFSIRTSIVIAAVLQTCALIASSFVTNVYLLYFTYSTMGGIANGLGYLPSIVAVSLYFDEHRRLANSLASTGAAVGVLAFPPILDLLIRKYAWQGAMIVCAGFSLNGLVAAALIQNLDSQSADTRAKTSVKGDRTESASPAVDHTSPEEKRSKYEFKCPASKPPIVQLTAIRLRIDQEDNCTNLSSPAQNPTASDQLQTIFAITETENKSNGSPSPREPPTITDGRRMSLSQESERCISSVQEERRHSQLEVGELVKTLPKVDVTDSIIANRPRSQSQSSFKAEIEAITNEEENKGPVKRIALRELFSQLNFYLSFISGLCWTMAGGQVFHLLARVAIRQGIPSPKAALIITGLGASNLSGRLITGFCDNGKCLSSLTIFIIADFLALVPVILIPFAASYSFFMIISCAYGLMFGFMLSNMPPSIVEVFTLDLVVQATGWTMFGNGLGAVLGGPTGGVIYDLTGSYDGAFYLGCVLILISVSLHLTVKCRLLYASRRSKPAVVQRTNDP